MNVIAAVDKYWGIGLKGRLLVSIPSDMKFFRKVTTGNVVVMGRKTLESFPQGQPLKNRVNIVLTSDLGYRAGDTSVREGTLIVVHSQEELMKALEAYSSDSVYVIGGESIYRMMLPYCDTAYLTRIDHAFEADAHFPNLDEMAEWEVTEESDEQTCFDLEFRFVKYEKKQASNAHCGNTNGL